jgi:hypothetical protein
MRLVLSPLTRFHHRDAWNHGRLKLKLKFKLTHTDTKVIYRRYASLFFITSVSPGDNELITLEIIHRYVEVLDRYFGNVSGRSARRGVGEEISLLVPGEQGAQCWRGGCGLLWLGHRCTVTSYIHADCQRNEDTAEARQRPCQSIACLPLQT